MHLPRRCRTVRMRLTALYCVLFVLSAALMLAITNGVGSATSVAHAVVAPDGSIHPAVSPADQAHAAVSHQFLLGSLIALGVMAVLSVVVGWVVAGRVLRPLRVMTAAARRISADSLDERLAMPGPGDELKDLAGTIDGLLARLESAFAAQRRFVANASHELRTPLATMRACVDVAVAKPGAVPAPVAVLAGRLRGELDKADGLLEGLLTLARAQHGELPGQTAVPLDYAVSAALAARAGAIGARNLLVHYDSGPDGSWVRGSQPLLRQMIDNLLDNAIGHNRPGGWIRVATTGATTGASRQARLVVENGGAVLDPAQVAGLGQPFRRLGADRTGPGGAGLGLSIVAAIAEAHGGALRLDARPEGGLRASVALPVTMPAPARAPAATPAGAGA
jgi:signal transduction histidine kinase